MHPHGRYLVFATIMLHTTLFLSSPTRAVELSPQGVVRQFCQLDGMGQRVSIRGWPQIAPLVSWSFEPAWDHVVLISGYSVGPIKPGDGGRLLVGVDYSDVGQVSAFGFDASVQLETLSFELQASDSGRWRINGPPPPPHIFADRADIDAMRRSFEQGGLNFLPNTLFVWQMMRSAGWNVAFERTIDLPSGPAYRVVDQPAAGDVVLYSRDGSPYHAGLLEGEDHVVSSTLNGGIVHTPLGAFAGDVTYLRLAQPDRLPTAAVPPSAPAVNTPAARPTAEARALRRMRTPTPRVSKRKKKPPPTLRRATQLSARKHVKKPGRGKEKSVPRPTPVATRVPQR